MSKPRSAPYCHEVHSFAQQGRSYAVTPAHTICHVQGGKLRTLAQQFWRSTPQKVLFAMPYEFTSPTATEDQSEKPAAAEGNLPAKVGHPVTVYSEETAERVCELIATGHNLRQIEAMRATEPELPARRTIHAWVKTRPDFERAYYRYAPPLARMRSSRSRAMRPLMWRAAG